MEGRSCFALATDFLLERGLTEGYRPVELPKHRGIASGLESSCLGTQL